MTAAAGTVNSSTLTGPSAYFRPLKAPDTCKCIDRHAGKTPMNIKISKNIFKDLIMLLHRDHALPVK